MTGLPVLRELPYMLRRLLASFLFVITVGYTLGIAFVDHTTAMHPAGIAERYLGSESVGIDPEQLPEDRELQYEKTSSEMLTITHTHILSLSLVFLAVGGIFFFASGMPSWVRSFLIIEPFVSIILTFGGMWLLRYHSQTWSLLIAASGTVMSICFYTMVIVSLWQLLRGSPQVETDLAGSSPPPVR